MHPEPNWFSRYIINARTRYAIIRVCTYAGGKELEKDYVYNRNMPKGNLNYFVQDLPHLGLYL